MSKKSRGSDNSKRQQPVQQQRAQARQPLNNGPSKSDRSNAPPPGQDKRGGGEPQR